MTYTFIILPLLPYISHTFFRYGHVASDFARNRVGVEFVHRPISVKANSLSRKIACTMAIP